MRSSWKGGYGVAIRHPSKRASFKATVRQKIVKSGDNPGAVPVKAPAERLTFEFLGRFRAFGPDGAPLQFPSSKDEALLACLALSRDGARSRDALTGLLWSTRAEEQARASLRQSLWSIKKSLGVSADKLLAIDRRTIALRSSMFDTDVARFEQLAGHEDLDSLRAAAKVYAGDFLDGVNVRDPAWEEWLRAERTRLRSTLLQVLTRLSVALLEHGDGPGAVRAASQLLTSDPVNEKGHRALMQAYLLNDQRGMALRQYDICREALERELGVEPSSETERLRGQLAMPLPESETETSKAVPGFDSMPNAGAPSKPSVVVIPFTGQFGDKAESFIAAGLTESVIMSLSRFPELFVIGYKTAAQAGGDSAAFGARLGVQYAVEGSVRKSNGPFRITTQLVRVADGERLWAERFDRMSDDLLAIEDELSERIVTTLAGQIEHVERRRLARKRPENMAAYEHVLLGRECLNRYTLVGEKKARAHFSRALETEPQFAPAIAGLAVSYLHEYESSWSEDYDVALDRAYDLARKAVELDEAESMAHYALSGAYYYRKEYELAKLQVERAIQVNPLDYHNVCEKGWILTFTGDLAEGMACSAEAMRRNPLAPDNCLVVIGVAEFIAERYEAAVVAFGRMRANSLFKLGCLAACYAKLNRMKEARAAARDFFDTAKKEFPQDQGTDPSRWQRYWSNQFCFRNESDSTRFFEALRAAGLPA